MDYFGTDRIEIKDFHFLPPLPPAGAEGDKRSSKVSYNNNKILERVRSKGRIS